MAAKPSGEEKSSAPSRGFSPARIAAVGALLVIVIVLAVVLFSGGGGHKYTFVFNNAGQLVPDNQVMIGGSPVGTVESIGLTDNDLAEVNVEVSQQLHEGSTAVIRATSLSGVANHYVSISPGPNSNPVLDNGAELGLSSTTTPIDIDQLFNTFPPPVLKGLQNFIKGNSEIYVGRGKEANESYKYFGTALNRASNFAGELNADERLLSRFIVSSSRLTTAVAGRGQQLSSAIDNANTAFNAISSQTVALDSQPARAAAGAAAVEHDLRQPARRPRRRRTAGRRRQAGDQEPGPVPGRTAPGAAEVHPLHPEPAHGARQARQGQRHPRTAADDPRRRRSSPRAPSRTPKRRSPPSSRS